MPDITAEELKKRLAGGQAPVLIDVREAHELEICRLPGALHVPMGDVPSRLTDLEEHAEAEVVVYCHHGVRSASVQNFLRAQGFDNVRNLIGGIHAYADVDESIARY